MGTWQQFLTWLGPPRDDTTLPQPGWYRYGPTLFVLALQGIDIGLIGSRPHPVWIVECVVLAMLLLERRRWPLGVFGVATATEVTFAAATLAVGVSVQSTLAAGMALYWLLYSAARWTELPRYHLCAGLIVVGSALAIPLYYSDPEWDSNSADTARSILLLCLMLAVVVGSAILRRRHCSRVAEQKRFSELQQRNEIANEVHDVVGHHLSAIALRAEGARSLLSADPSSADEALVAIRGAAAEALQEIRGVIHSISSPRSDVAGHGPTLENLSDFQADGVAGPRVVVVASTQDYQPSNATSRAAYRIVQEAITNARRHAHGATQIDVVVQSEAAALVVEVRDDGRGPHTPSSGEGHGLKAMSSRSALLGGTFHAGPSPEGGWLVSASFPLETQADKPEKNTVDEFGFQGNWPA